MDRRTVALYGDWFNRIWFAALLIVFVVAVLPSFFTDRQPVFFKWMRSPWFWFCGWLLGGSWELVLGVFQKTLHQELSLIRKDRLDRGSFWRPAKAEDAALAHLVKEGQFHIYRGALSLVAAAIGVGYILFIR